MNDKRDEVGVLLCQPDLALEGLLPSVRKSKFESEDAVGEPVAEQVYLAEAYRHDWVFRTNRSDGRHVRRFSLISLIAQFRTHTVHNVR